jgi:uncharacterized membrane protein
MVSVLIGSLVLGIVSGLRAFLAPAALYLARGGVAGYVLGVVAAAELVGDMLPKTPSRTVPLQLLARVVSGGFVGWMLCAFLAGPTVAGAALGVVGALVGTYGGAAVRGVLIDRIGPIPAALTEDVVAIALALLVVMKLAPVHVS